MPFIIRFKDAEEGRIWKIALRGILIGPAAVALWCFTLQLGGGDQRSIWQGDPLTGVGGIASMLFALIVGFLATGFYVTAWRIQSPPVSDLTALKRIALLASGAPSSGESACYNEGCFRRFPCKLTRPQQKKKYTG